MAVSDSALFILIAQLGLYATLYSHKVRLWRIIGCFAMITVGLSAVMVEDTLPAFVFAGMSAIIAGSKLFHEVTKVA